MNNRKQAIIAVFRYALFLWEFEKAIYKDPEQDLENLYQTLTAEIRMPKNSSYKLWYDTTVFASPDLYYVHYTLAHLYAFQLEKLLEKKFGPVFYENPEAGTFLIDNIMQYGRSRTRKEIFEGIFGTEGPLIREYIDYLTRHLWPE